MLSARTVHNRVRGFAISPGTWTELDSFQFYANARYAKRIRGSCTCSRGAPHRVHTGSFDAAGVAGDATYDRAVEVPRVFAASAAYIFLHPAADTGKFQGKVLKSGRFVRVSAKANTSETAFRGPRLFRDGVFIVRLDQVCTSYLLLTPTSY